VSRAAALVAAQRSRTAVPGFVAYNLETAQGIVRAAERTGRSILLQAGASPFKHAGREALAELALREASASAADVGVHLDHSRSLEELEYCVRRGYSSVMIDGSHLPFDENVALTAEAVRIAHAGGAWVEAELTGVAGDEDASSNAVAGALTDPDQAAAFVAATGIDALAVAVGNVHGLTEVEPEIDLDRLAAIRAATPVPLVLHGASGLSRDVLLACVDRGVAKVNVNTELRRAFLQAVAATLPAALERDDLAGPLAAGRDAVTDRAAQIIRLLAREEDR
jgi:fructose-bisphosphate aldolase class II/tagatose 1,6-diphosphate aldolase GatY/KbaY